MPHLVSLGLTTYTFVDGACISTNTGILNELKEEDFFKIIPIKDEEKLLEEIINHQKKAKLNNSKEMHAFISEKFSVGVIAKRFSSLYEKALKN